MSRCRRVYGFFRDPGNWAQVDPAGVTFQEIHLTREGLGTHYTWTAKIAGITLEGFDVFTEFVPDRRITHASSSALEGTWTYIFEPDGSGTRLTIENRVRSVWRLRPLERILDLLAAKTHEPRFERIKRILENA